MAKLRNVRNVIKSAIANLQQAANLFRVQGMNADAQKALDAIGQLQR